MSNEIEHFIIKNDLRNTIICKGFISFGEELLSIYKKNDFFLFPSYSEGLPQVLLEAMANGCIVISTNVGSIPFIIKDNYNGILIQPHCLDSILNTIKSIIDTPVDLRKIRINALITAQMFSFENQIQIFEKILNE
jgi:glycosyltransferase involved in cell wall biosynthesis